MGRRVSVVECATCKREIAGSIAVGLNLLLTLSSWAKPLPTRATSRSRGKSEYLVGPRRLVCESTVVMYRPTPKLVAARLYAPLRD